MARVSIYPREIDATQSEERVSLSNPPAYRAGIRNTEENMARGDVRESASSAALVTFTSIALSVPLLLANRALP